MSGLIWAGIGKGIADAGAAFGSAMAKGIEEDRKAAEAERQAERLLDREERRAALKEEADKRKLEREEEQRAQFARAVDARAKDTAINRDAAAVGIIGSQTGGDAPAMSQAEIAQMIKENPQYRDIYRKAGYIKDTVDPRLQNAMDQEQAALEMGGKPSVMDAYGKARKETLLEIAAENKERKEAADRELALRREDRRDREATDRARYQDRMAGAAETRAERADAGRAADSEKPPTTADLQRQVTAATNALALELGVARNELNGEIKTLRKRADAGNSQAKATLERIQPMIDEYNDANTRMLQFKRGSSGGERSTPPASSGNNGNVKRDYGNLWK